MEANGLANSGEKNHITLFTTQNRSQDSVGIRYSHIPSRAVFTIITQWNNYFIMAAFSYVSTELPFALFYTSTIAPCQHSSFYKEKIWNNFKTAFFIFYIIYRCWQRKVAWEMFKKIFMQWVENGSHFSNASKIEVA